MSQPQDRLRIWSSQLAANDFPPVCAVTGEPAETWRRFNFGTMPVWALPFALAHTPGHIAMHMVERRAIGHLPLTRASNRRVALRGLLGLVIGVLGLACWAAAVVIAYSSSDVDVTLFEVLGFFAMPVAVVVFIAGRRSVGPQGTVVSSLRGEGGWVVEIWNLHPGFVNAATIMYQGRLMQSTGST